MFYVIQDNQVKFIVEDGGDASPYNDVEEYTVLEGNVGTYYDLKQYKVLLIPPKPTEGGEYIWTGQEWSEVSRPNENVYSFPDFTGLLESLRGSDVWNKIIADGGKTLKVNIAVTLLIAAVTATKNIAGIKEALKAYHSAVTDSAQTVPFSKEQQQELQEKLDECNININLKELLTDA